MLFFSLPGKNKGNPVKRLTDGNPDAKPSHRRDKISVEMNLVMLLGVEIKPRNHGTGMPRKRNQISFKSTEMETKVQNLLNRQAQNQ